jgi:sugar/nucleoside kinase (ribokinase family)
MKLVPETCLKVLLPQGYMRHINADGMIEKRKFIEGEQLLTYFDAMVTSDEDSDDALRAAVIWATYKEGSSIVVTQSSKGATLFNGGQTTQVPTTPIAFSRIKNPVGSGDMFSAQLALGLYDRLDPADAVRSANETTAKALLSEPME